MPDQPYSGGLIYLASPYMDDDPNIRYERYIYVSEATARMLMAGYHVFSPITHCHDIAIRFDMPRDHDFWLSYDFTMLARCNHMWVLGLDGWDKSKGVAAEIHYAQEHDIPWSLHLPQHWIPGYPPPHLTTPRS